MSSFELRVVCPVREAPSVGEALTARGWGTLWIEEPLVQDTDDEGYVLHAPPPDAPAVVHAYPTHEGEAPEPPRAVRGYAVALVPLDETATATDWSTAWRASHSLRTVVAPGWVLRPPWGEDVPGEQALVIEPGGAFGTGAHPTTRDSLRMLHACLQVAPGGDVLDLGTGSGVLAIAAVRWGAGRVVAVDSQDDTLAHVRANAALNGLAPDRVEVVVADLADVSAYDGARGWHVVLCNVGAADVERALAVAPRIVRRGGTVIASGIFAPARARVEIAARVVGLAVADASEGEGWVTLALRAAS